MTKQEYNVHFFKNLVLSLTVQLRIWHISNKLKLSCFYVDMTSLARSCQDWQFSWTVTTVFRTTRFIHSSLSNYFSMIITTILVTPESRTACSKCESSGYQLQKTRIVPLLGVGWLDCWQGPVILKKRFIEKVSRIPSLKEMKIPGTGWGWALPPWLSGWSGCSSSWAGCRKSPPS